jgi:hypothetical protein
LTAPAAGRKGGKRMKKLCKTGYVFDELSEAAKEKVKEWYLDDPMRGECLTEDFEEAYLKYFFANSKLKVQWSLSSCQGDGVNICGDILTSDIIAYIRNYNEQEHGNKYAYDPRKFTEKQLRRLEWYSRYMDAITLPENRRYYYCLARHLEFADELIEALEDDSARGIDRQLIHDFEDVAKDIIGGLCSEMEHNGYEYLYECDNEEISETCAINEWYFDASGNFISGWKECV